MKKGFTLIEMLIVVVVLAIMISMIPFRMQSLQAHTKFSLYMNDWEDFRQKTITSMRQSNQYKQATITLNTSGIVVVYSGVLNSGLVLTKSHSFPQNILFTTTGGATGDISWELGSYGLSCPGYNTGFQIAIAKNSMCYRVDTDSCNLLKVSCKRQ